MEEKKTVKYDTIKKEVITVGDRKRTFFIIKPTTKAAETKKTTTPTIPSTTIKPIKKGCSGCNRRKSNS